MRDEIVEKNVRDALSEDVGSGDLTAALVPDEVVNARVIARESAVICGRHWFNETFRQVDPSTTVSWQIEDGDPVSAESIICHIHGHAQALLTAERTALNFLQTLSGTATLARRYADAVAHTTTRVLDTRKTIPGLRDAQKYAVTCGGCHNHRHGLYDAVLIKENHIRAAGSIAEVLEVAARNNPPGTLIEIEAEDLDQLEEAIAAGAKRVLLDNFSPADLNKAVAIAGNTVELEASGGITLDNIAAFAETGVDFISIGALTKHLRAIDLSMRFD
ncbi:MAG: nicotinate-nucleotide pyrophosphorylase [Acidithiobacillales bacterium SG8_45]|jgi:nicotinate-nucleotide pyrophosphorylase (carboxylating)|nr:MAG: nicotinate-nucleotide pyrophosphorylase [Acidithiobacillales bacterium SG8_45]